MTTFTMCLTKGAAYNMKFILFSRTSVMVGLERWELAYSTGLIPMEATSPLAGRSQNMLDSCLLKIKIRRNEFRQFSGGVPNHF